MVSTPVKMLWSGWGDPQRATPLPAPMADLLEQVFGTRPPAATIPEPAQVILPTSRLAADSPALAAFTTAVGEPNVDLGHDARLRHTRGKSTPDLLRIRSGEAHDAPDAVISPANHDEILAVLRACATHRIAAVPFGGGTSVVGGLTPRATEFTAVVALDLRRLNSMLDIDPVSRTAVLQAGLRAPAAEALLAEHGFILGHFPQSYEYATIGGFAATGSSGQSSAGYGRFDDMVLALTVATPEGTVVAGRAPASAAGPDPRRLFLGSEGVLGVITDVTVRIRPIPAARRYEGWRFPTFADGAAALRRLAQDGPRPTVLRLSDELETAVGLARATQPGGGLDSAGGCLAIVGFEGTAENVLTRSGEAAAVLTDAGGTALGTDPGEGWEHGRFAAPYLRDSLLDVSVLVETLETATFWSKIPQLYTAVSAAITDALTAQGTTPIVLCHISHLYETGASLYFTVACAQTADPIDQWNRAKAAASDAIAAVGGTITHHHGVGTDHQEHYAREVGPLTLEALRAVKRTVDPTGILNPGILVG